MVVYLKVSKEQPDGDDVLAVTTEEICQWINGCREAVDLPLRLLFGKVLRKGKEKEESDLSRKLWILPQKVEAEDEYGDEWETFYFHNPNSTLICVRCKEEIHEGWIGGHINADNPHPSPMCRKHFEVQANEKTTVGG